jgi:hypothetical protein
MKIMGIVPKEAEQWLILWNVRLWILEKSHL